MIILDRKQIEGLIDLQVAGPAIEAAYVAASAGKVRLPPVGHIAFPDREADCHVKFGHTKGDENFVIKVATGFRHNAQIGLPNGNGVSLVLSAQTGAVQAVLHDEMVMTDIRTGLGGAIATRCLSRPDSQHVLIVGTGAQAERQIESHLAMIGDHLTFGVWGRSREKARRTVDAFQSMCGISEADDLGAAVQKADIIVTATGASQPLIKNDWVTAATHITAVGADAPGKQELDPQLVSRADVLVPDSIDQSLDHGEFSHGFAQGTVARAKLTEIGTLLCGQAQGRRDDRHITIADLTGIAAQDIAIAAVVLDAHSQS